MTKGNTNELSHIERARQLFNLRKHLPLMLPGRAKQVDTLLGYIGDNGPVPGSIYIFGHTATGKSVVVKTLLETLDLRFVDINCVECDTIPLLVRPIADQISYKYMKQNLNRDCNTLMDLLDLMNKASRESDHKQNPFFIVLDHCERLLNMPPNILPVLLRLQELSGGMNVCILMLSELGWDNFIDRTSCIHPITIHFPQYKKSDIQDIMMLNTPTGVDPTAYKIYLNIIIRMFYLVCRNLNELHYMAERHLSTAEKYLSGSEPIDMMTLWRVLRPILKDSMKKVYLREGISTMPATTNHQNDTLTTKVSGLELPYYAKYLLISAFLASHNSPKNDARLFMKYHGKQRKKAVQRKQLKMSSLLLGPKPFSFERLMAIFHAVAEMTFGQTNMLYAQLTTLVNLKLITKVGHGGLDDPKYKCAAGFDFISKVGESVKFNVSKYILDNQ